MKKLLIANLLTAVIVLGIIAAYSFKPEQKAGAKYATVIFTSDKSGNMPQVFINVDGKAEIILPTTKGPAAANYLNYELQVTNTIHQQLEKLEGEGFQLVSTASSSRNENHILSESIVYTLRKP